MNAGLKGHKAFHYGRDKGFSHIEYCDRCGYSKSFIMFTNTPCRKIKNNAEEVRKQRRGIIVTGFKVMYGYWSEQEGK